MEVTRYLTRCCQPPSFFRQTYSVFPCDHTAPRQYLLKEIVECALNLCTHSAVTIVTIRHDVDVNIAVSGVAKAGDRESMLGLQFSDRKSTRLNSSHGYI